MERLADRGYLRISVTRGSAEIERTMARLSFIVTIIVIALACVFAEELYSDKYDDIDVDGILENEKLRMQYYNCFIDVGPCKTADAKYFKEFVGEAVQTNCKKCTEKQKMALVRVTDWYKKNQPDEWNVFIEKRVKV